MRFQFFSTSLLGVLSLSGIVLSASTNSTEEPVPGVDYAEFDTGVKLPKGRSRGPDLWYLGYLFWKKHHPKCEFGKENCCYGKDDKGCCIGGSGNCNPCPGPRCPIPCFTGVGPGCPPPVCPGPACPYPNCPGPACPYICPGPLCWKLCPGPRCPIRCPGPNCPVPCPGPLCPIPCYGPQCGIVTCPPQICNFQYNGRPIIFNVNINQNIIINGPRGKRCVKVPTELGVVIICGPPDKLICDKRGGSYQVQIKDPTSSDITFQNEGFDPQGNQLNDPRLSLDGPGNFGNDIDPGFGQRGNIGGGASGFPDFGQGNIDSGFSQEGGFGQGSIDSGFGQGGGFNQGGGFGQGGDFNQGGSFGNNGDFPNFG